MTRLNKDVMSGALFVLAGAAGLIIGADYPIGTAFRMGSGYFPRLLCSLLVGLGLLIAVTGFIRGGERPEGLHWRPILFITIAVVAFGSAIATVGLAPAAFAVVFIGAIAGPEFKWGEGILLAILLTAAAVGLFKYGLSMTMPIIDLPFLGVRL